jgi:hypothetical protein
MSQQEWVRTHTIGGRIVGEFAGDEPDRRLMAALMFRAFRDSFSVASETFRAIRDSAFTPPAPAHNTDGEAQRGGSPTSRGSERPSR